MNVRRQVMVSAGAIVAMLALSAWAYGRAPGQLTVRWNAAGEPAGVMDRGAALLIVPLLSIVLTAVFALAPAIMPRASRLERSSIAWSVVWMILLANMLFSQVLLVAANLGVVFSIPRVCSAAAAVVIFLVGNWLGKIRHNLFFGIRTPWTLASDRVWDKTHRFVGRLLVIAALLLGGAALALPWSAAADPILYALMLGCIGAPVLAGVVYSALITRPA